MKQEESEVHASNIIEGKDHSDCSSFDCDDIENDLEDAKKDFLARHQVNLVTIRMQNQSEMMIDNENGTL